jgi:hypothetical protein
VREDARAQRFGADRGDDVFAGAGRWRQGRGSARRRRGVDGDREDRDAQDFERGDVRGHRVARPREQQYDAHLAGLGDQRRVGLHRLETRRRIERNRAVLVAREQQRAHLGDQPRIAAEQETERLAYVRVYRIDVDALADHREEVACC